MRQLSVIGIGSGDPRQITLEAVDAIAATDVFFVVVKDGADELTAARRRLIAAHHPGGAHVVELEDPPRPWRTAPDYAQAVATWRARRRDLWETAVAAHLSDDGRGALLAWGDPSLYESTLAIVRDIPGIALRVVPGVSSLHALTARHAIELNRMGRAVQILPARRLAEHGMPPGVDDVVVMLDAHGAYAELDPGGLDVYWGAHLGTPHERLRHGPLAEVAADITRAREEARAEVGWLFDIYLLRRR